VLGTHVFDLMRCFAADPEWVFAHVTESSRDVQAGMKRAASEPVGPIAGDSIAAMFGFPNGVHGYFASQRNDLKNGRRFGVSLHGSKAVVFVPLTDVPSAPPYILRQPAWAGGAWSRIDYPAGTRPATRAQTNAAMALDLLRAIESGGEPACSARDARWTIEMVAGIYQSHLSAARIRFPLAKRTSLLS